MENGIHIQGISISGFASNLCQGNGASRSKRLPEDKGRPLKSEDTVSWSAPDLKEKAKEMLPKERRMGKFKDQDWVGEAKNLQIGPDIRFAVKSRNPDFLRRIIWGPLTTAEFREVSHRLKELERKSIESHNILKGKIFDEEM